MASVSSIAVWFSNNSGSIEIFWLGWNIETTLSIFFLLTFMLFFLFFFILLILYKFFSVPFTIKKRLRKYHIKKSETALETGILAAIYGDKNKITKNFSVAKKHLKNKPLLLFLKLQDNLIKGNKVECFNTYKKMLEFKSTSPIAIKGLISLASKNNDAELFSNMLNKAKTLNVSVNSFINEAVYFSMKNDNWFVLKKYLEKEKSKNSLRIRSILSVLNYQIAYQYYTNGESEKAKIILNNIFKFKVYLPPLIELYCNLSMYKSERNLKKILKAYWKYFPHYNILNCVLNNFSSLNSLKKVRLLMEILDGHDNFYLRYLILAEIKYIAKIWGDSKKDLLKSVELFPSKRAYLLLADIEEKTTFDKNKINDWIELSKQYDDEVWICNVCKTIQKEWTLYCSNCNNILSFFNAGNPDHIEDDDQFLTANNYLKIA